MLDDLDGGVDAKDLVIIDPGFSIILIRLGS
jgi:hypothetical protein